MKSSWLVWRRNFFPLTLLGAIAKALATVFTYPIQVAQSRQRANKDKGSSTFASTFKILYDIFKKDGPLGWYVTFRKRITLLTLLHRFAGMNIKLVQTILTAAFQFMCYEKIQQTIFSAMGRPVVAAKAAH